MMSPAEREALQRSLDNYHEELKEVYDKYVDDLTEDYKKATVEIIIKYIATAFLSGVLIGLVLAFMIGLAFG